MSLLPIASHTPSEPTTKNSHWLSKWKVWICGTALITCFHGGFSCSDFSKKSPKLRVGMRTPPTLQSSKKSTIREPSLCCIKATSLEKRVPFGYYYNTDFRERKWDRCSQKVTTMKLGLRTSEWTWKDTPKTYFGCTFVDTYEVVLKPYLGKYKMMLFRNVDSPVTWSYCVV